VNANANDAEVLFSEVKAIKRSRIFESHECDVYRIERALAPWKWRESDLAQLEILRRAAARASSCPIWLANHESAATIRPDAPNISFPKFVRIDASEVVKAASNLVEGGWGLFFFEREGISADVSVDALPVEPAHFCKLLSTLGANIGVISWHDNVEQMIALAKRSQAE
jgi:hypothetical protein